VVLALHLDKEIKKINLDNLDNLVGSNQRLKNEVATSQVSKAINRDSKAINRDSKATNQVSRVINRDRVNNQVNNNADKVSSSQDNQVVNNLHNHKNNVILQVKTEVVNQLSNQAKVLGSNVVRGNNLDNSNKLVKVDRNSQVKVSNRHQDKVLKLLLLPDCK
jgi:hypothetical protein